MARTGFWVAGEAERLDAVQDAAYDRFLEVAVTCRECGTLYDQGYHPATPSEPVWAEQEECPNSGSGAIADTTDDGGG